MNFFKKKSILKQHALPITTAFLQALELKLYQGYWVDLDQKIFWENYSNTGDSLEILCWDIYNTIKQDIHRKELEAVEDMSKLATFLKQLNV